MPRTLDDIIEWTLDEEGGFSDNPADPGGVTNFGQTIPWLTDLFRRQASRADVLALTKDRAAANYALLAHRTRVSDVAAISPLVAAALWDFGVNSGLKNPIRAMQKALATTPDGVIGSRTLDALETADEDDIATEIIASRLELWARLVKGSHPFITGWLLRLARQMRSLW